MSARRATPAFSVGIDLGTTHTVVAWAPARGAVDAAAVQLFRIEQLVAPGEVEARALLPSMRYHAADGELAAGELALPWSATVEAEPAPVVIGELARSLGAQVPGRLVASAKSWLSHAAVDRQAAILPWGGAEDVRQGVAGGGQRELPRARARGLEPAAPRGTARRPGDRADGAGVIRRCGARAHAAGGARGRTARAAPARGAAGALSRLAVAASRPRWRDDLAGSRLVLVCDVGGGTTDLSLVRIDHADATGPRFERVAVGRHLMLGGDNMDLAIAHQVEAGLAGGGAGGRLNAGRLAQLIERCRAVKERLLADGAAPSASVTLLGGGARLVGGARSVELQRDAVRASIVDGFFPRVAADARPLARALQRAGFVRPAVCKRSGGDSPHRRLPAAACRRRRSRTRCCSTAACSAPRQSCSGCMRCWPTGAVRRCTGSTTTIRTRRWHAARWRMRWPGAVRRRRIAAGSARSYFLQLDDPASDADARPAVCLLPHGSQPGHEVRLDGRAFALRTGAPVRFHLAATTAGGTDAAFNRAGALVDLRHLDAEPLPPIATVIRDAGARSRARSRSAWWRS